MHEWLLASTIFNAIVGLVAGIFVYTRDRTNPLYQAFSLFCFSMTIWAIGYCFPAFPNDKALSLLSFQLLHLGAIFIGIAHFYFVTVFLGVFAKYRFWIYTALSFKIFVVPCVFLSDWFIADMVMKPGFGYWASPGWLYSLWLAVGLGFGVWSILLLIRHYKLSHGLRKKQIGYVIVGDFVTFVFGSTNFFYFYNIDILPIFSILASGQMLLFAYIILRFQNYRLQRIVLVFAQKLFSIISAVTLTWLLKFYLKDIFDFDFDGQFVLVFLWRLG